MPLSDAQRNALLAVPEKFRANLDILPSTIPESVEQRARRPAPGTFPPDVAVSIEIAPPSLHPHPILESTGVLKTPERVPVYFYSLDNSMANANSDSGLDSQDPEDTRVIFFIHGGGNVACHPTIALFTPYYVQILRAVASQLGEARCVLIAPSYRLATVPENVFPAALQDIVAAYDYILEKGYKASNIIVAGDSAGGNHAIVLTHLALQSSRPCPHGVVAIAPGSIQTNDFSDYAKTLAENDIIDLAMVEHASSSYVGGSGIARSDPLVSGSLLPFTTDWPKTLILVGSGDLLIDASRELKKRLTAIGRPVELVEYDERPHGWWVLPQIFPEDIRDSTERIARFIL